MARPRRRPTPEKAFQARLVTEGLHPRGWVENRIFPLRTDDGSWRTGSTLKGWPDIFAFRAKRFLAIEVKAEDGRLRPDQLAVLSLLAQIPVARVWVLDPTADWDTVMGWLDVPRDAPPVFGFDPMDPLDAYRVVAPASARKAR